MTNSYNVAKTSDKETSRFLGRTYGWMTFALLLSGFVAYYVALGADTAIRGRIMGLLFGGQMIGFWLLAIAEILVVLVLSARIRKMSVFGAVFGFTLYSVLNGLTLSTIFFAYNIDSIYLTFFITAGTFFLMSIWGLTTKRNLSSFGHYLMMGLLGIILTSLVGGILTFFTGRPLPLLDLIIALVSVVVFSGLAAWDSQKVIKTAENARDNDDYKKVSILAALELYLDFINLFLALLRFFGRSRD